MTNDLILVPIDTSGTVRGRTDPLSPAAADTARATVALYRRVGFEEPWIGYLAVEGATAVGAAGFTSVPRGGRVEIAYYTFPEFEGRGRATAMARALIDLARAADPEIQLTARTLPDRNASHRILEKLGFRPNHLVDDPEHGSVLEWSV